MTENEIHKLVREIAANMGFEWHYASEQRHHHGAIIKGPEGCGVFVRTNNGYANDFDKSKSRLHITGEWPERVNSDQTYYDFYPYRDRPEITASAGRPPAAIAKDILRRFVPKYLPVYREKVIERENVVRSLALEQRLLEQLAEAGEMSIHNSEVSFSYNGPHLPSGKVRVSLYQDIPTVEIKVHGIPFDVALEVVKILKEASKNGGGRA